jgi:hypothetical protein
MGLRLINGLVKQKCGQSSIIINNNGADIKIKFYPEISKSALSYSVSQEIS